MSTMFMKIIVICCFLVLIPTGGLTCGGGGGGGGGSGGGGSGGGRRSRNFFTTACNYYPSRNQLTCKWRNLQQTCPTVPASGSGPTPYNRYLIDRYRPNYNRRVNGVPTDWFNLLPKKKRSSGYYEYNEQDDHGRSHMGLHPGRVSLGCVTVKAKTSNYNDDWCWKRIRKIVENGINEADYAVLNVKER